MHTSLTPSVQGDSITRFADIEILRYEIPGFEGLPLDRKLFIYHLSEAALSGRDITFDQNGRYGLRLRTFFEELFLAYRGDRTTPSFRAIETYLFRLWFSSGIHHHYGSEKFEPAFTEEYLREILEEIQAEGILLRYRGQELDELLQLIFDPTVAPRRTVQSGDEDLVKASSANFYAESVTQAEATSFYAKAYEELSENERLAPPSLGLNSRLAKTDDGELYEQVYRQSGLYGEALTRIISSLKSAVAYAETEGQRHAILALIEYYKTGDLEKYNDYCIAWVEDTESEVDFINGFTEVYTDPLGTKGMWESLVHIRDHQASQRTQKICAEAKWFEDHAPIDAHFKKEDPRGVSATVVSVAMLAGDSYPATPIGINLPNADWIRASHGSKSVTIDNIHRAYHIASLHSGMDEAFVPDPAVREMLARYGEVTEHLHTDLHECLGHGSGKLLPGVSPDALGSYHSTLEEARADLFALYYMADEHLVSLGLLPDMEAYKACYYRYLLNGLVTQLVRIRPGHMLEEAHMRNRALIARYVLEKGSVLGAVELRGIELIIHDYDALRPIIADLLAEVQRIKSEGDQTAGRALVERYAISVDPVLHAEVLERYAKLNIAPYKGFVNPRLELVYDEDGGIVDVRADYTEGYAEQMLRYSRDYATLPLDPVASEELRHPVPSEQTLLDAKELRTQIRRVMDGQVASSMREKGLHYGINFGLTLDYILRLAEKQPKRATLASYLLSRDVRELKLIGQLIYPAEAVTYEVATELALSSFANPELRDYLAKHLFDRTPSAPYWALDWIFAEEGQRWEDLLPVAFTILARWFSHGFSLKSDTCRTKLLQESLRLLASDELPYPTALQRSVLLMLKRWGRDDAMMRQALLSSSALQDWEASSNPLQQEFAADLRFELEEYISSL